ncbi:helix-turn-helix transcriptional regulator [Primorskyibacter flagellatus]|uniref:helix-turn-helix transcriptional regulator n=1 Tax=Primorskyibacter flagellatus TaxID=1387277 RepID=UPI00357130A2
MMTLTYVSIRQLSKRYGVHASTVWRWRKSRGFPEPYLFSPQCARWKLAEIEAWEAAAALRLGG